MISPDSKPVRRPRRRSPHISGASFRQVFKPDKYGQSHAHAAGHGFCVSRLWTPAGWPAMRLPVSAVSEQAEPALARACGDARRKCIPTGQMRHCESPDWKAMFFARRPPDERAHMLHPVLRCRRRYEGCGRWAELGRAGRLGALSFNETDWTGTNT